MIRSKFKNILLWFTSVSLVFIVIGFLVINYDVNQFWGAHTQVVDIQPYQQDQVKIAIVDVNTLSVDGEFMRPGQTVLINKGLITYIGAESSVPDGFQIIDGSGKYLIPGLIDSHVHLWQSPNDLLLYLANGVTHIKELNGSEEHLKWKSEILAGRPGPDLFVASQRHSSQGLLKGWFDQWTAKLNSVNNSAQIASDVKRMMKQGYDAIKIYTFLNNEHFKVFNQLAKDMDITLLGHIPINMSLQEMWQSEMKELAHVEELVKALSREYGGYSSQDADSFLKFVEQRSSEIVQNLLDADMAVVSTLALVESFPAQKSHVATELKTVELIYVNPGISEATYPSIRTMGWLPEVNIYRLPEDFPVESVAGNLVYWQTYAKAHQILIKKMAEVGVKLMAGTDANVPVMVPGFSMHEELKSLTQTGMSAAQALRSATSIPAQWMGINSGQLKVGFQADLLLLSDNPLDDINHTQSIDEVITNGRRYNKQQIKGMLKDVRNANDSSRKQAITAYQ